MRIAVLGTGMVGEAIGTRLVGLGHEVRMGSRTADNESAREWVAETGARASQGTFADAAAWAELSFLCVKGDAALAAVAATGAANLAGKPLLDLTNPLDFSQGRPPTLFVSGRDSLGEQIQRAAPEARVVKTLNTCTAAVMVEPTKLGAPSVMFLAGNDAAAKATTRTLLESFGWKELLDLGDLSGARGMESWLPLWLRLWGTLGVGDFNLAIVRAPTPPAS